MASVNKRKWTHKGVAREAWAVRYKDDAGVYRSKSFDLKKDADAYKRKVEREMHSGLHVARGASVRFGQLCAEYLASLDRQVRDGKFRETYYMREDQVIRTHLLPTFRERLLCDLKDAEFDNFIVGLKTSPTRTGRAPALATQSWILGCFVRVLDYAVRRKWMAKNNLREVRQWQEHRGAGRARIRTFTLEQIHQIYLYAQDPKAANPVWTLRGAALLRLMVYLGMFCGLRSGEIRGLPGSAVDLEAGLIEIDQQLNPLGKITAPKTKAGVRQVPIPDLVADEIRAWQATYGRRNEAGLIITTRTGKPLPGTDFHKLWKRMLTDLGMAPDERRNWYHFHALRHFASAMMMRHMPVGDVPIVLGHRNLDTTLMIYAQPVLTAPARRAAFAEMAASIVPAPLALPQQ